jgi:phosphotriesterase-related protein
MRDFNYISDVFLPAFRRVGASEATVRKLTVENPANAFAIRPTSS